MLLEVKAFQLAPKKLGFLLLLDSCFRVELLDMLLCSSYFNAKYFVRFIYPTKFGEGSERRASGANALVKRHPRGCACPEHGAPNMVPLRGFFFILANVSRLGIVMSDLDKELDRREKIGERHTGAE